MSSGPIDSAPAYAGIWMSRREPLAYRVLPKCGCSSVGQILHHLDHGAFYAGSIHDASAPILKWQHGAQSDQVSLRFASGRIVGFTLARNPYRRLLSSFADKIFGYQADGRRYRAGRIHRKLQDYGLNWRPKSDLVANFHVFVRFVADTIEQQVPMPPDIHWAAQVDHLRHTAWASRGWLPDHVGQIENFRDGISQVLAMAGVAADRVPIDVPRENATALPELPMSRWYGRDEVERMLRIYADDFRLLGYSEDPDSTRPAAAVDLPALRRAMEAVVP
jgi:Sulfotransferase family